jgi:hypothetical protein
VRSGGPLPCIISLKPWMKEAQPGMEPTTAGTRRPSRFCQTCIDYDGANGRIPSWQDAAGSFDLSELRCSEFCLLVTGAYGGLSALFFDVVDYVVIYFFLLDLLVVGCGFWVCQLDLPP